MPASSSRLAIIAWRVSNDPEHPLQIALRTYSLALSLVLGPPSLSLLVALATHPNSFKARASAFWRALSRELCPTGFASAMTAAAAGGAALQRLWSALGPQYAILPKRQRAFLANLATSTLAFTLLRSRWPRRHRKPSPSLDLTILFLVRALDASVQAFLLRLARGAACSSETHILSGDNPREALPRVWQKKIATHLDALVFWASSARIMWCFFYQPQRLPLSYVKWITSLAGIDKRLLQVLRAVRQGKWSYIHGSSMNHDVVTRLAEELGRPPSWGDPTLLPAYGGGVANEAWNRLGVSGRRGIGGLPCELVHGAISARFGLVNSCTANAAIRAIYAFAEALVIYLPVHFLPILLANPRSIVRLHRAIPALLSAIRSAAFLSTFLSSYWFAVCFTRTLVLARLFPNISHDVWDGPYGCTFAGSLVCGASIWIENARRRGEITLYVLPKALRASIPETWLRSDHPMIQFVECLTFVLSLASLLTVSVHRPDSLRGLSRWTLAFVMKGSNAGFWKRRKREIATCPPTPKGSE